MVYNVKLENRQRLRHNPSDAAVFFSWRRPMTQAELKAEREKEAKIKAEIEAERAGKAKPEDDTVHDPVVELVEPVFYATYKDMLNQFSAPRWFLDGHCKIGDFLELLFETLAANGLRSKVEDNQVIELVKDFNRPYSQPMLDLLASPPPPGKVCGDGANVGIEQVPPHMHNRMVWYAQLSTMDVVVPLPADGKGVPTRTISGDGAAIPRLQ